MTTSATTTLTTENTYEVICTVDTLTGKTAADYTWRIGTAKATVTFTKDESQFSGFASDLGIMGRFPKSIRLHFDFCMITFVPAVEERNGEGEIEAVTYRGLNSETSLVIFND